MRAWRTFRWFFALAYFQNTAQTVNLEHLNFQVITLGRVQFLKMLLAFGKYLRNNNVLSCNTDGLYFGFEVLPPAETFAMENAFFLDFCLKPSLSLQEICDYLRAKIFYFIKPGVCPEHVNVHASNLFEKDVRKPPECCLNYESLGNNDYKLKVEIFADFGIVLGSNQSAFLNSVTKKSVVKCSGPMNPILENFCNLTEEQLNDALHKCK